MISLSFIAVCCLIIICLSCSKQDESALLNTSPEQVLAELPVYPGAVPQASREIRFEPFSTPLSPQVQYRPPREEYETGSMYYKVQADAETILDWYCNKLSSKGYRKYTEMVYNSLNEVLLPDDNFDILTMGFYNPELPEISIEVHVADLPDTQDLGILVNHEFSGAFNHFKNPPPEKIN